jgi:hypothetical protein
LIAVVGVIVYGSIGLGLIGAIVWLIVSAF